MRSTAALVRRPENHELDSVRALVRSVADEIYGDVLGPPPVAIDEEDWSLAWIAEIEGRLAGMILTQEEWINDLWVLRETRRRGVGRKPLAHGEAEIIGRGYGTFRLRVVKANKIAVEFYLKHG